MFEQYSCLDILPNTGKTEEDDTKVPPPSTFEEWLEYNNLESWPIDPLQEIKDRTWLHINIGAIDDLREEICQKVPCQINLLDDILQEADTLERTMSKYSELFFDSSPRKRKTKEEVTLEKYIRNSSPAIEKDTSGGERRDSRRESRLQKQRESLKAKNMDLAVFPGFHSENMLLPGALEGPQLLNNITRLQQFPLGFRKIWKQFFLSEASVSILQDAFWWIFLEHSKSSTTKVVDNKDVAVSQSKLFDRMANNFVSLFISVPYNVKDSFFRHYSNCLSQAVYAAFTSAFPLSTSKFNLEFREHILGLILEWVSGIQMECHQVLKTWKLDALDGQQKISVDTIDEPSHVLKSRLSFNEETFLDYSANLKEELVDSLVSPSKKRESHPASTDIEFTKLQFNIFGQSPFVKHYLSRKHLQNEEEILNKIVTRTERNEKGVEGCPTYNDLIQEHKTRAVRRKQKHDCVVEYVLREVQKCSRLQKNEFQSMKDLECELLKGHSDIKILSQKIMDMMEVPSVTGGKHFVIEA